MVLLITSCAMPSQNQAYNDIKIGVILPLTGENAVDGKASLAGIQLAVDICNKKGGVNDRKIQLIIGNNFNSEKRSQTLFKEMAKKDNIVAVIGGYSSNEALAMKYVAEKLQMPYIAQQSTNDEITNEALYTFRPCLNDTTQGVAIAYYMYYIRQFQSVAVMINTGSKAVYARDLGRKIAQSFATFSRKQPFMVTYSDDKPNFREDIKKFIYDGVEAIVMPAYPATAIDFVNQARSLGFLGTIIGTDSYDTTVIYKNSLDWGNAFYSSGYFYKVPTEENKKFVREIKKRTKTNPGFAEAMGYDGMNMLIKALNKAYMPENIAMNLRNMKSFPSVLGEITLDNKGEFIRPVVLLRKTSTGPKFIKVIQPEEIRKWLNSKE